MRLSLVNIQILRVIAIKHQKPLKSLSFALTKNFLLPLQIKMGTFTSKLGKVLKIVGTVVLICTAALSCFQVGASHVKAKSFVTSDGEPYDTIIFELERFRSRIVFDILKSMAITTNGIRFPIFDFPGRKKIELKSYFVNFYQRNVFYIYTLSSVP
jgi:hypothetical protein